MIPKEEIRHGCCENMRECRQPAQIQPFNTFTDSTSFIICPINDPKASEIQHSKRKTKYRVIRARSKPGVWETGSGETRFGFFPVATAELPRRKGGLRVRARLSWELCGCKERTLEVHGERKRWGRGGHSAVAEGIVGREREMGYQNR